MHDVVFYYDFISPYSWLALARAEEFAERHGVCWRPRPVVYAKLLDATGLIGPAETTAKRRYTFHDVTRCAAEAGLSLQGPPRHPFRSLEALRTALLFDDPGIRLRLSVALADACWAEGRDLTDIAVLRRTVARVGLDATDLERRIVEPGVKQALRDSTAEALELGVFGVPSFVHGGELFWGHDRMDHLAARLDGRLPAPDGRAETILQRPRGADRRQRS